MPRKPPNWTMPSQRRRIPRSRSALKSGFPIHLCKRYSFTVFELYIHVTQSVSNAEIICRRVQTRMKTLERMPWKGETQVLTLPRSEVLTTLHNAHCTIRSLQKRLESTMRFPSYAFDGSGLLQMTEMMRTMMVMKVMRKRMRSHHQRSPR